MKSKVYFIDIKKHPAGIAPAAVKELCLAAGFDKLIDPNDAVAVKMHFGEGAAKGVVPPKYIKEIVGFIKDKKADPFLTDTATLYSGDRSRATRHIRKAVKNGYGPDETGAHVIIADGIKGVDFKEVNIGGEYFKKVKIASALYYADVIISVSHFKGHELSGFGATLKNIGMGGAARPGKLEMHSSVMPVVSAGKCRACLFCIKNCPANAIVLKEVSNGKKTAQIDTKKCIGCGYCFACSAEAIGPKWDEAGNIMQKKMAEYAFGAIKDKKAGFINFLFHITPKCDCYTNTGDVLVPDIGIVVSLDPVAADSVSLDLFKKAAGNDKFREIYPDIDANAQLEHAQRLGMGSAKYELISL